MILSRWGGLVSGIVLWAFCASVGLLFYTYVGYPILAVLLAKWFGRSSIAIQIANDEELPRISVLIAAYNAEQHIENRLRNLLDTDFPKERMEVIVATDGCTDQTARLARQFGVRVVEHPLRRGKTSALVETIPSASNEVLVFTDVTTEFDPLTLRRLAERFVDPTVGIVAGCVNMYDPQGHSAEGLYWRLESRLRRAEASLNALIGASGAVYAIRRRCFVPPTSIQLNDDLVFPMLARLRTGKKLVLEPNAVARVVAPSDHSADFRRRVRVGIGAFQSLREINGLIWPTRGFASLSFFSHKLLRWGSPWLLVTALITNILLSPSPIFRLLLMVQGTFYLVALGGAGTTGNSRFSRFARAAASFLVVNAAFAVAFVGWLRNRDKSTWEPTTRPSMAVGPHPTMRRAVSSRNSLVRLRKRRVG